MRFQLPRGATGIDHHSGASFKADRFGRVDLPDGVARDFVKNGALRHYDVIAAASGVVMGLGQKEDIVCPTCFRTSWEYETVCPRCGTKLREDQSDSTVEHTTEVGTGQAVRPD